MTDANPGDAGGGAAALLGGLTKMAAILGSLIAVGQAATTWIDGIYTAEAEREKTEREIKLAELKDRSALAESYLQLILSKDTPNDSRGILYSALAELKDHPLQQWAQKRFEQYRRDSEMLANALQQQSETRQRLSETDGDINALKADIQALNVQILQSMDDEERVAELQRERIAKSAELSHLFAARSVAEAKVEAIAAEIEAITVARAEQSLPASSFPARSYPTAAAAAALSSIGSRVDTALLRSIFPESAWKDIDDNVQYLQAALQEFKISDPRMISAIIGTIAVEAPAFKSGELPDDMAANLDDKLGNTEPGDGVKFKGRGYILITGRTHYARMSELLGLGTRLIDAPEDAKSPEVAARIAVAWFVDRQDRFMAALDKNDLRTVRRLVAGVLVERDFERFQAVFHKSMDALAGVNGVERYKIFVHLGQSPGRGVPPPTTVEQTLKAMGFAVAGSDRQSDQYGPGVDYFHDVDQEGAAKVAEALTGLLGPDQKPVKARKQKAGNPEGTLGVWF